MDAAVLLEAGWTDMVHEVWVTVIPEEEVICLYLQSSVGQTWSHVSLSHCEKRCMKALKAIATQCSKMFPLGRSGKTSGKAVSECTCVLRMWERKDI